MSEQYISTTEAAKKWGISDRRAAILCKEGRISGVINVGGRWIIPADAEKPSDARIKSGKYIKSPHKTEEPPC